MADTLGVAPWELRLAGVEAGTPLNTLDAATIRTMARSPSVRLPDGQQALLPAVTRVFAQAHRSGPIEAFKLRTLKAEQDTIEAAMGGDSRALLFNASGFAHWVEPAVTTVVTAGKRKRDDGREA